MEQFSFLVQGSPKDPYSTTFARQGKKIIAKCSCPAGINGQICKHRLGILSGSGKNIVSDNPQDAAQVASWLPGSELEEAWGEVAKLESELENIKAHLSVAKKRLSKAMLGIQ